MKKVMLTAFLMTACGAISPSAAAPAPGASMLAPGVYTTPAISTRCQTYTRARVSSQQNDSERQSVFIACVQKLYRDEYGSAASNAPAASPEFTEAPVALSYGARYGYGCSTDEGYGRRGSCDTY